MNKPLVIQLSDYVRWRYEVELAHSLQPRNWDATWRTFEALEAHGIHVTAWGVRRRKRKCRKANKF